MPTFIEYADAGFEHDIVPIMPPDAVLSPLSKINPEQRGKIPSLFKRGQQCWIGFPDWATVTITRSDALIWDRWGEPCGVGLRAAFFPGIDQDCERAEFNKVVLTVAHRLLGPDLVRRYRSNSPRWLLCFRLADGETPLPKMRAAYRFPGDAPDAKPHATEILGRGNQWVAEGMHPSGSPYAWDLMTGSPADIGSRNLPAVTATQLIEFFEAVKAAVVEHGGAIVSSATGGGEGERLPIGDDSLRAKDLGELARALAAIPNDVDYDGWIALMAAVKTASNADEKFYAEHFAPWSMRHPKCEETYMRTRWDSIRDAQIGADYIYGEARKHGFQGGVDDMEPADNLPANKDQPQLLTDANGIQPVPLSEFDLACEFVEPAQHVLRYVAAWGKWMKYDGRRWVQDDTLAVYDAVRKRIAIRASQFSQGNIGKQLSRAQTVAAIEKLAKADSRIAATSKQWDGAPWLLNTPGGTVDLTTGELREHRPKDYCTKMTTVLPGGECPLWRAFLDKVTGGDRELQEYLQMVAGYGLTGDVREQCLFFSWGTGGNGKGVFHNTLTAIWGDYATTANADLLTAKNSENHPTELARLRGARLVVAQETEAGKPWREVRVKSLTGGDPITARFMRGDFFEYMPQFKLLVAGNHKPPLLNVDNAMRRRIHMIPFNVSIPENEKDPQLFDKLREEWPGILQWAIDGCMMWQRCSGLKRPPAVRNATDEYLATEDRIETWKTERLEKVADGWVSSTALFHDWRQWAGTANEHVGSQKAFSQSLKDRGMIVKPTTKGNGFAGIKLKPQPDFEPVDP
ncbi:MAG TPA: phage/plasmid primase, P4 family [Stellaceae bacterium]|jgi:putative DNA primase/helicase|nr:phage/plasmid primase, P4 family [Stellaceae bacterium]